MISRQTEDEVIQRHRETRSALPEDMARTLYRAYYEGVTFKQIGARYGWTRNKVAGIMYRLGLSGTREQPVVLGYCGPSGHVVRTIRDLVRKDVEQVPRKKLPASTLPRAPKPSKPKKSVAHKGVHIPPRPAPEGAKIILAIKADECKAPVGDKVGADQLFCAQPVAPGYSYCPGCIRLLYNAKAA